MVMMECPDTVNTLLHEFFLWEPDMSKKNAAKTDPDKTVIVNGVVAQTPKPNKPMDK